MMEYAPVLIPTLNRYDHFTQCLESLEKCVGADKTIVYVGLDYPPSEKYVDGWRKIAKYLESKERANNFKRLVIDRRPHNCGIMCDNSNATLLMRDHIFGKSETYIFSEDDNVFAPNFLEYINKGLEKFKNNPNVLFVCGYSHPYHFKYNSNNYFFHRTDMSAWGYGGWTQKHMDVIESILSGEIGKKATLKKFIHSFHYGYNRVIDYVECCFLELYRYCCITDSVLTAYMISSGMNVVMPATSKVRNIGWDSSGSSGRLQKMDKKTCEIACRHFEQQIDTASTFEYEGDPYSFFDDNNRIAAQESDGRINVFVFLKTLVTFLIKRIAKEICYILGHR